MTYVEALTEAMTILAEDPRTVFLGQAVEYPGTAMFQTLKNVPMDKRHEMPVAEDMQMGVSIGLSLAGYIPISIYPRWNFLLLAANQLVNHLDKLPLYSRGGYWPKVIVRTAVPSVTPLNPQAQHVGDFTEAFRDMCATVQIVELDRPEHIVGAYTTALDYHGSTIIVERIDDYET